MHDKFDSYFPCQEKFLFKNFFFQKLKFSDSKITVFTSPVKTTFKKVYFSYSSYSKLTSL